MQLFFVDKAGIDEDVIRITGGDVKHIGSVLRMKTTEEALVSDESFFYEGQILSITKDEVLFKVKAKRPIDTELPVQITLFQGLPKQDKLETIIQKSIELGVYKVVPVETARAIVKLDEKKRQKRLERWAKVAESAAKQSKRGYIPAVNAPLSFKGALTMAKELDVILLPYEAATGMEYTREALEGISPGERIGIFIGPEGGFAEEEVAELAAIGAKVITLGSRILRTETAGPAVLSMLTYLLEGR